MYWQPVTQSERGVIAYLITEYRIWHDKKAQYVPIEMPCPYTDAKLRKRYLRQSNLAFTESLDVPTWWLEWQSTREWIASLEAVQPLDTQKELDYLFEDGISEDEFTRRLAS